MSRSWCALAFLALANVSSSMRMKKATRSNAAVTWDNLPPICEQFATDIPLIRDNNFTGPLILACKFWPAKFGEFPIKSVQEFMKIMELSFGDGGVWDLIQLILRDHEESRPFCWRANTLREVAESNCQMTVDGVCYASCPEGYKPKFLSGRYKPVCETACIESSHPIGCGFGCAQSYGSCGQAVLDQVGEVAQILGFSAVPGILPVIDEVIDLANFVFEVLTRVVEKGKDIWDRFSSMHTIAALVISFFQVIAEARRIDEDLDTLYAMLGDITEMLLNLIDGERRGIATASFISSTIIQHGISLIRTAVRVLNAFTYPHCKALDTEVVFTVEGAGREEVVGPYIQRGTKNDHPYYTHKNTTKVGVEYDTNLEGWSMYAHVGLTNIFKKSFYTVKDLPGVVNNDYPVDGWVRNYGREPAPKVVPLRAPMQ